MRIPTVVLCIVTALGFFNPGAATAQDAKILDLGTLGGTFAAGWSVNIREHVVGQSRTASGESLAFFWQYSGSLARYQWNGEPIGTMTSLGTLPGYSIVTAKAVNARDQVVGYAQKDSVQTQRAFFWEKGQMTDLGLLPGDTRSRAMDINVLGKIAGESVGDDWRAVVWWQGQMTQLEGMMFANAINARDQVAGASYDYLPAVWRDGVLTDLGMLPGFDFGEAVDINDRGEATGMIQQAGTANSNHCFFWEDGEMTDLGLLPGYDRCFALSINNDGTIVGYMANDLTVAPFMWKDGVLTDLNTFLPPDSGWTLYFAQGINDLGEVVGRGSNANGSNRAFLLQIPVKKGRKPR